MVEWRGDEGGVTSNTRLVVYQGEEHERIRLMLQVDACPSIIGGGARFVFIGDNLQLTS